MKSNKQRRSEIVAQRRVRTEKLRAAKQSPDPRGLSIGGEGTAACNPALLAPYNSYGVPPFVARGYYVDAAFECAVCKKQEIWRATQQKWWYEVAKGDIFTTARRCRAISLSLTSGGWRARAAIG